MPKSAGGRRLTGWRGCCAVALLAAGPAQAAQKPETEKQPLWGDRSIQWSPKPTAVPFLESPALAEKLALGRLGFRQVAVVQRQPIAATHIYTYHHEGGAPGGGLFVLTPGRDGGAPRRLVDAGDGQIHHLDVSFDGAEILFNWRKGPKETYQVWRIGTDGTGLKQLTSGPHHNYDACWLPDGEIAFLSTRRCGMAYCWSSAGGVLHRMDRDGGHVRRISHNLLHDFTPAVMDDGRLIYMRWEYVDRGAIPTQSLWTINPDGTNLQVFFGNRIDRREGNKRLPNMPEAYFHPRQIPGTPHVLCVLTGHYCQFGGLGILDPARGDNARESLRDITRMPGELAGFKPPGGAFGPYESPQPIDGRYLLVSALGTLLVRSYDGDEAAVLLNPRGWLGFYDAQPIRARTAPPARASTLTDAGTEPWATVLLQDVYRGLEPHVKRGDVKQICVVEEMTKPANRRLANRGGWDKQSPAISCGATYAPKKVWGFADVEADGSACFVAPAGVPIYFMALDAQGRAVQRMRSFTHFMPGAVEGCVGCHEPRSTTPAHTRSTSQAVHRGPKPLLKPSWGVTGFSYPNLVQPVLDTHCVRCHGAENPPKGVRLTGEPCLTPPTNRERFNTSYVTLTRRRPLLGPDGRPTPESRYWPSNDYHNPKSGPPDVVANLVQWTASEGGDRNIAEITPKYWGSPSSPLADLILSGHRGKDGKPRVSMDEASRRIVMLWMDLNVPYYGSMTSEQEE
jgi:hypothetical protein